MKKKNYKKKRINSNYDTNINFFFEEALYNYKYDIKKRIIRKEKDNEEILRKFIECFNQKSE